MKRLLTLIAGLGLLVAFGAQPALANHSWNGYHWARTSNPFTIKLGSNLSADWKAYLATASSDWSKSTVLDTTIVPGQANRRCGATPGRVEVCNGRYGNNGWLGLASISVSKGGHITQGTVKVNDTYFALPAYNFTTEKQHVICQEVGHTFGLDHQDTSGASLNTCMDYYDNTSNTDTLSIHPNRHDYDELAAIYSHLDTITTIQALTTKALQAPELPASASKARSTYVRHFADGSTQVTFVTWAR